MSSPDGVTRTHTASVEIPVYQVTLEDETAVRFHDYEMENGGLRIQFKRLDKFGFSDHRDSNRKRSATPSANTETYRDALVPFAELHGRCVSPIQVGTVSYTREYEYTRERTGRIFTNTRHRYKSTGETQVEYEQETLVTSGGVE